MAWEDGQITDPHSIRGIVGEFVACVGPRVAAAVTLDFSR
jgi:arginine-tRNA-protein transferase